MSKIFVSTSRLRPLIEYWRSWKIDGFEEKRKFQNAAMQLT